MTARNFVCISVILSCACNADDSLTERVREANLLSPSKRIELLYEVERAGFNALDDETLILLLKESLEVQDDQVRAAAIGLMGMYVAVKPEVVGATISEQFLVGSIELGSSELAIESAKLGSSFFEGDEDIGRSIAARISSNDEEPEVHWQLLKLLPRFGEYSPQVLILLTDIATSRADASGKYAIIALTAKEPGNAALTDSALSIMKSPRLFCDMTLLSMIGDALPVDRKHLAKLEEMDKILREQSALPASERTVSIYNDEFYRVKMDEALLRVRAALNS